MSGLAPQAAELAGRVGDGYRLAMPDAGLVRAFRAAGAGHLPVQAGMEVDWDADRDVAAEVAHRPVGHLRAAVGDQRQASCPADSPLPRPRDCADAMTLVSPGAVAETIACRP